MICIPNYDDWLPTLSNFFLRLKEEKKKMMIWLTIQVLQDLIAHFGLIGLKLICSLPSFHGFNPLAFVSG